MKSSKVPCCLSELFREAFQLFDKDGNGTIEIDELKIVLSSLGQPATQEELEELMKLADIDGDGTIDLDEVSFSDFQKVSKV